MQKAEKIQAKQRYSLELERQARMAEEIRQKKLNSPTIVTKRSLPKKRIIMSSSNSSNDSITEDYSQIEIFKDALIASLTLIQS